MSNISNISLYEKFIWTIGSAKIKSEISRSNGNYDADIPEAWIVFSRLKGGLDFNRTYGWNVQHITEHIENCEKLVGEKLVWDCPREYVWVNEKQNGAYVHTKIFLEDKLECERHHIDTTYTEITKYSFIRIMKGYLEHIKHRFNTLKGYRAYASRKYWDEYREGKAMYELVEKVKASNWNKFEAHKNLKNEEYELLLKECPEVFRTEHKEHKKQEVRASTLKKVEDIKEKIAFNITLTNSERVFKSTHKALFN